MKNTILRWALYLALPCISLSVDQPQIERKKIFVDTTDGFRQIQQAAGMAEKDGRRLLVLLGAEWCVWCHRLFDLLQTNPVVRECVDRNYLLVPIPIDQNTNIPLQEHFDNPRRLGLPVLLVLNSSGGVLTMQETGSLEEGDGYAPRQVLAFLEQWVPARRPMAAQSRICWESITLKTSDLVRLWRFYRYGLGLASDWDGQSPQAQFELVGGKLELQLSAETALSPGCLPSGQFTWRLPSGLDREKLFECIQQYGGTYRLVPAVQDRYDTLLVTDPDGNAIRLLLPW